MNLFQSHWPRLWTSWILWWVHKWRAKFHIFSHPWIYWFHTLKVFSRQLFFFFHFNDWISMEFCDREWNGEEKWEMHEMNCGMIFFLSSRSGVCRFTDLSLTFVYRQKQVSSRLSHLLIIYAISKSKSQTNTPGTHDTC